MSTFNIDVEEHRMRETFDALENGQNTIALKCVQAALKKHPGSLYAKAVRALVYHRLGQGGNAVASADEVIAAKPTEIAILNMLLQTCKHYPGQCAKLSPLYEQSWKLNPSSEEHGTAVFLCAVRDGDFKKQQSTISTLISTVKTTSAFSFWRLASIYCNAKEDPDPATALKKLSLCHAIFDRLSLSAFTLPTQAEFYIQVLEDLNKWEDVARLLRPAGEDGQPSHIRKLFKVDVEADEKYANALAKLGKAAEAQAVYKSLITNPEGRYNWLHFLGFVQATVELMKAEPEKTHSEAVAFLESVQKTTLENDKHNANRGPFLAVIELEKQRTDNAEESTKLLIESYVKYVKQFSNKPYCIFDSRPYLEELITKRGAKPEDILSQVTSACSGDAAAATTTTTALTTEQHTLIYAVQRMLGLWGSKTPAELAALAEEMVALHRSATTDATELALLVHLAFVDLHNAVLAKTGAKAAAAALVEDAAFLEGILAQKENNPQVRLCLLDVYHRLCAFKLETEHFWNEGLGVKSVLLESCSYLYIADALRYCNIRNTTSDLLSAVTTVHHENEANVPDYVLQGYTQQSYCKVAEIARFRAKLRRSALLALASAETPLLRLYGSQDPVATLASIGAIALPAQAPLDVLTDNSDYAASLAYGALSPIVGTEAKDSIRCKCYAKESINTLRASLDVLRATQDCDSSDKFAAAIDRLASAVAVGEKCSPVASWADVKPAAQRIFLSAARVLQTAAAAIKSKDGVAAFEAQAAEIVVLINAVEKVVAERAEALKSGDEDSAFSLLALDSVYDGVSALVTQALSWGSAITQVLTTFLPAKKNANSAYNKRRKTAAKSSALPAIKAKSAELSAAFKGLVAALKTLLEQLVALPNDAVVPAATEYPVKGVEPTVEFNSTLYVSYRETLQDFIDLVSRIKM